MSEKPKFNRGGAGAKEKAKTQNLRPKTNFFALKDGESSIIRLIDDGDETGWIHVMQHAFVPTKGAPKDYEGDSWPKRMGAVCRHDDAFTGLYHDCYICDSMHDEEKDKPFRPTLRLWARCVIRERVIGTEEMADAGKISEDQIGKRLGMRDRIIEVPEVDAKGESTGRTVEQYDVQVINMGMKNFFGALQGAYEIYGTVLDRDFVVTREGSGTDTDYSIVPLDQIRDKDGNVYTLEDSEIRSRYLDVVDLDDLVAKQASDEHFARFFDKTKTVERKAKSSSKAKAKVAEDDDEDDEKPESAQRPPVNEKALAEMRERAARAGRRRSTKDEAAEPAMTNYS